MNWPRTNKLLAGFLIFVAIGVVVLGYLLFSAYGAYSKTEEAYKQKARELSRLQALKPYPNQENLKREIAQRDAFAAQIDALQKKLSEQELPLIPLTPEQFQDKLRQAVSKVVTRAGTQGVSLPEGFYLGFEEYRDALPIGKAAGPLGRQLDAIQGVVAIFLDNRVDSIGEIQRQPLPEESRSTGERDRKKRDDVELVSRSSFRISMTSNRSTLRRVINTKVSAQQFYILRLLTVQNEELKGPARGLPELVPGAAAAQPEGADAGAVPGEEAAPNRIELLLGDENVTATFEVEIVDFAAPASEESAAESLP